MSPTVLPRRQLEEREPRHIESVQRALELLRLFLTVDREAGIGVTDAAAALGISKSSASRMLGTLQDAGFTLVDRETRRHFVGPTAFAVGTRFAGSDLARLLNPILRSLSEHTRSTAQLGILRDTQVMYLSVVLSSAPLRVSAEPGDLRYAHSSSMGKAILASLPRTEASAIIESMTGPDGLLPAVGPHTARNPKSLRMDLDRVSVRGYSITNEEAAAGVSAFGAVIPNTAGLNIALSISFAAQQLPDANRDRWAERVVSCAQEAGRLLASTRH